MEGLNPWTRANLESFNVDTLNLIPQGQQQEYITLMKELAHSKSIVALAIERMYMFEQERAAFFEGFICPDNTKAPEGAVCDSVRGIEAVCPTSDYTPVTDLDEYRRNRERT